MTARGEKQVIALLERIAVALEANAVQKAAVATTSGPLPFYGGEPTLTLESTHGHPKPKSAARS